MTSLMSGEVDPLFLKAIFLLHSKNADSAQQLQDLLHDYKEKTFGFSKARNELTTEMKIEPSTDVEDKKELISTVDEVVTNFNDDKRELFTKFEESVIEEVTSASFEPILKKQKIAPTEIRSSDFIFNEDLSLDELVDYSERLCTICSDRQYEEDNCIVQCSECHLHYHQKCHEPIVNAKDMNDPRLIWYCSICTKQIKKEMVAHQHVIVGKSVADNQVSNMKSSKFTNQSQPFRRPVSSYESKHHNLK